MFYLLTLKACTYSCRGFWFFSISAELNLCFAVGAGSLGFQRVGKNNLFVSANFVTMIRKAYEKIQDEVCHSEVKDAVIEEFMRQTDEMNFTHRKHLMQHSSIIGNILSNYVFLL